MVGLSDIGLGLIALASVLPSLNRIRSVESSYSGDCGTTNAAIAGGYYILSQGASFTSFIASTTAGVLLGSFVLVSNNFAGLPLSELGGYLAGIGGAYGIATFFDRVLGLPASWIEQRRRKRVKRPQNPTDLDVFRNFGRRVSIAIGLGFLSNYYLFVYLPSLITWFPSLNDPLMKSIVFALVYMTASIIWLTSPKLRDSV